jgi:hypothetical protein
MSKKSEYLGKKKVDHFARLEEKTKKPKIKFIEETLEIEPIKKAVKTITLSRIIRRRIAEIKATKEAINFAINSNNSKIASLQESVIQTRRLELINIKKMISAICFS